MSTLQLGRTDVSPAKSKKKRSIKWKVWSNLIIKKKNEKNLTIRKFSKQEKKVQTLPSGRPHRFWFWLRTGTQVSPSTYKILVLVKRDRRTGSQVSPTTQRILVLVKGDRRTRSQVSPTMQILVLVKGDRRTGSQVSPTTQILVLVKGDRRTGS